MLQLPALPPKPVLSSAKNAKESIPYGYENVLPISQRYKQDPYGMLSSVGTETCSSMMTTSDEESEYLTKADLITGKSDERRKLLRQAIAQRTVIERSAENGYKKRLALSETSI